MRPAPLAERDRERQGKRRVCTPCPAVPQPSAQRGGNAHPSCQLPPLLSPPPPLSSSCPQRAVTSARTGACRQQAKGLRARRKNPKTKQVGTHNATGWQRAACFLPCAPASFASPVPPLTREGHHHHQRGRLSARRPSNTDHAREGWRVEGGAGPEGGSLGAARRGARPGTHGTHGKSAGRQSFGVGWRAGWRVPRRLGRDGVGSGVPYYY